MTVPTLVQILQARGITLWLDGDRVRCRAPKGVPDGVGSGPADRTSYRPAHLVPSAHGRGGGHGCRGNPAGTALPPARPLCAAAVGWPATAMPDMSLRLGDCLCLWADAVAVPCRDRDLELSCLWRVVRAPGDIPLPR
jgi:hypothetical protein